MIEHLQKLCDAYDWADPHIDEILRRYLRITPSFQRKQWEFAMIYRALDSSGLLNPDARGIAFGAGRERLLYALSNRVRHVLATDLYGQHSAWVGARTAAPKQFLLEAAPFEVDPARLDAAYMDMRHVEHGGEPVDFCYSSCAFEHIGTEDAHFLEHLRGVSRILRPGGVYALTTELRYGPTLPVPHNFFFSLDHLIDLAMRSGLAMHPVFDARLARNTLNAPNIDGLEFGIAAARLWQPSITPWRQGIVFTSALLILRKQAPALRPQVLGYAETEGWVHAQLRRLNTELWKSWQSIAPDALVRAPAIGHEDFAQPGKPAGPFLHTAWTSFGEGRVAVRITPPDDGTARPGQPVALRVSSRPVGGKVDPQPVLVLTTEGGDAGGEFLAEPGKVYAVVGTGPWQPARTWGILARRV
ncbi:class I SAM-dependent methyltransferase [Dankookia rubra]|nr:class I SAM-dependent methyltransferase [Dankookia rubra]